ncbi:WbqC-like family protein [Paludibacter propionicigenes WB4]|uniref:WbqC-like family protein n=1 Tax=Paludibacter propionicigenes (strain DSM 17365 / JCM 13257 / WB4) TaxID=694427 RepID=E4T310_PALPW|nr:WbqC family protein [Paludibacter propionicigenes]ADQ79104.1 WbqC-like family protein [Paludibacter propionicigenes WB4]
MLVSIHQPDYLPWLGYFNKIALSDVFVFLDDAQFSTDNIHNWNRIKSPQGELKIKIPVEQKLGYKINEVRTKDELKWREKHLKSISMFYRRAPYYEEVFPDFENIIMKTYPDISKLNETIIRYFCDGFGIQTKFLLSSDLNLSTFNEERVIDICKAVGGTRYYSGNGAKAYQVEEHFTNRGIQLEYTHFEPFEYPQQWGNFIPCMSVIDYVMNCGFKKWW